MVLYWQVSSHPPVNHLTPYQPADTTIAHIGGYQASFSAQAQIAGEGQAHLSPHPPPLHSLPYPFTLNGGPATTGAMNYSYPTPYALPPGPTTFYPYSHTIVNIDASPGSRAEKHAYMRRVPDDASDSELELGESEGHQKHSRKRRKGTSHATQTRPGRKGVKSG